MLLPDRGERHALVDDSRRAEMWVGIRDRVVDDAAPVPSDAGKATVDEAFDDAGQVEAGVDHVRRNTAGLGEQPRQVDPARRGDRLSAMELVANPTGAGTFERGYRRSVSSCSSSA